MDLFKRIQDLSAIYDDDGPSATIQERPMFNDGGMLVQPSNDGSRPGYAKQKDVGKKLVTLKELSELDFPISESTLKQVFTAKDTNKAYKKIFKDNGIKTVKKGARNVLLFEIPTKNQIDGVWKDTIKLVQSGSGKATVPEKMKTPFKNEVLKIFDEFSKTDTPFSTSDIYYKLIENVQDNPRIFVPKKLKGGTRVPGDTIKTALGKDKAALLMDGNLQRIEKTIGNRKKLVDILSKGKSDINILSKTLGINKKDLFAEADILFDDLYRYTRAKVKGTGFGEKYGYLKDFDVSDYKNILNNLRASGFEKLDERSMRSLITEAFAETDKGKFKSAINRLNDYTKTNAQLKELFGFEFQLDHPLSFKSLKDLKNVSPENLLRVNPIPAQLNRIKLGLDGTYRKIINNIRQGDSTPELLNQKKAIETLSSKLGIGEFKIDNTGRKVLSFGADPFLRTNLIEKMQENVFLQDKITKNLKNIDPNLFTEALGKRSKVTKSIQKLKPINTKKIGSFLNTKQQQLIKNQFCPGNRKGGVPGTCDISEAMDNMIKQTNAVKQGAIKGTEATRIANKASKVARFGTGRALAKVLGPIGLAGEAVFEVAMAAPGYARGESGKRLLGDSILGLIPGVGQSSEEEFAEYATKSGMSQLDQQKIKDVNRFLELNDALPIAYKNIGKGGRGDPSKGAKTFNKLYNEYSPLYDQFVGGPPSESASTAFAEQQRINDLINADKAIRAQQRNIASEEDFMAAGGGIAKMAGDRSGPPPESGPNSQGLRGLLKRGKNI